MNSFKKLKPLILLVSVFVLCYSIVYCVLAYSEPLHTPPICLTGEPGCDAPLNVGSTAQTKTGNLTVGDFTVSPGKTTSLSTTNVYGPLTIDVTNGSLCLGGVCKTSWSQVGGYWQDGGSGKIYYNTGNVGIGTAGPAAKLTINTPDLYSGNTIRFQSSAEPSLYYLNLNTVVTNSVVRWVFDQTNAGTNYPNVLAFDRGNVGIGTAGPGAKLHIESAYPFVAGSDGMLKIKSLTTTYGSETVSLQTSIDSRTDDYTISSYGGDSRHLLVLQPQGGYVGIGTTNPANKLHVAGNIGATGWIGAGCEGACESGGGYSILYPEGNAVLSAGLKVGSWETISGGNIKADGTITAAGDVCSQNGAKCLNTLSSIETDPIWNSQKGAYATQAWVTGLGYTTQAWVQSQGYATQAWVNSQGFATQSWVNSQGFLKTETDPIWNSQKGAYATQAWVTGLGYTTQAWVQSQGYATQSWVSGQGFATQAWVQGQGYITPAWFGSNTIGKLNVTTIDPIYEIDGKKYATYVSDFAGGVRIETSGVLQLLTTNYQLPTKTIDFNNLEKGSDLWLFWQASNKNIKDLVVILTPGFNGKAWYEKQNNKVAIYSDQTGEVSYRLSMPRKDAGDWPNLIKDEN